MVVGTLILAGAVNTAIVGSNGVLNRVSEDGVLPALVPPTAPPIWHFAPHHQHDRGVSDRHDCASAAEMLPILANLYAFGVIWSFALERHGGVGAAL